jgi:hypothetical protein
MNFPQLKQTLIDELQVLVGKKRTALVSKSKSKTKKEGGLKSQRKKKSKELTIEEEVLILQQLAELDVS